jgi:hypothetical protein
MRSSADQLSISDLATKMGCDKAWISRFVTSHKIETWPGPRKKKLVNVAQFLSAFEKRETRASVPPIKWHLLETYLRESGTPVGARLDWVGTHWDIDNGAAGAAIENAALRSRQRQDRLSSKRLRRNEKRKRRSSI